MPVTGWESLPSRIGIPQRILKSWAGQGSAFLHFVGAGNLDSMVNHYSVTKKHRKEDAYSPGEGWAFGPTAQLWLMSAQTADL